ncbi:uncharacterized protein EV154DRAFT_516194 [Mucor mucedo]|uniref:uncharacterized protein n=1 Tax=Mucor mucedo TaxID=29922 RepID=UPI002220BCBC|nr:uncharacterized protein EV154DRAFT_516194 [Mucor mucedo]KAI7888986.1 hypothetical protein EV154DRAFT_516194 [Mucor mucedo]
MTEKALEQMTEEELDARLERVQQRTTAALQHIDENFSTCNRNLLQLSHEVDRFAAVTQKIWDNSQGWAMFFQHIRDMPSQILEDDTQVFSTNSTNRPVILERTGGTAEKRKRMGNTFSERLKYRRTPFMSDTFSSPLRPPTDRHFNMGGNTPSTSSSAYSRKMRQSPPRTVPFTLSDSQLQGTPIAEQVRLLTENTMHSVGYRVSDEEVDNFAMDVEDRESKERFEAFFKSRQPTSEIEAYEFSDGIRPLEGMMGERRISSYYGSEVGSSMSGSSESFIPKQFNLIHFPEQFRTPPTSIRLTKVYDLFNNRPGILLTVKDVLALMDGDHDETTISYLIQVLRRKKYIKQVGEKEAWVIRR